MTREHAVSEVIGSILLISLVGIAVAIIAIMFLSQPVPVETQSLNVIASYANQTLFLYHDGGDTMVKGEYKIRILPSGNELPITDDRWEIGEILEFPGILDPPDSILIISTREGQETLIKDIRIGQFITPGPITPRPTPTPGPGDDCVVNFTERLNADAIHFSRSRAGPKDTANIGGFINFTVNNSDSYLILGSMEQKLTSGQRVSIRFKNDYVQIFSIGNKGWSLAGGDTTIQITNPALPTFNGTLTDSWITSFTGFESTLTFTAGWGGPGGGNMAFTKLIIKNTTWVPPPLESNKKYTFIYIRPSEPTLFLLHYPSNPAQEKVLFIGQAGEIRENDLPIYPL